MQPARSSVSQTGTTTKPQVSWPTSSTISNWSPSLTAGPFWSSFEQLRTGGGASALETITPGTVGTLHSKSVLFRIMRDEDFQRLLGLAADVHRIKNGVTFIIHAARVVAKHKDEESVNLLVKSVSMLNESCVLPERIGHDEFQLTANEVAEATEDEDVDLNSIPRPAL